ncbi:MAG: putative outer membrane protein [Rhodobacteraceae bacterium HLUCCA08]|nr:MAG: putative outer membrane protein [Rhodobacteraceae bacterium HLUCCA08]
MSKIKLASALGLSAVLTLSACDELQDPNNPNRNAQSGALIGAAAGAALGTVIGNDDRQRQNVALGAVLGTAVGAAVGSNLDRQEAELRQQMGPDTQIVNTGEQLIVTMPQDILFAVDSAQLSGGLRSDLTTLAASLNRYPNSVINVIGHTDNTGSAGYNQDLSARRAQAVSAVLINAGVNPQRIRSIGRGEDAPIASNLTPEGRSLNRRVEITITPTG